MNSKALVVIDMQNDITKNYRDIVEGINAAIEWAVANEIHVVYIRHTNLSPGTRTFKDGTRGAELVSELKLASENVFTKTKSSVLTCEEFVSFIQKNEITDFFITGADATGCVKSACFNMSKAGYHVEVISDCITCYDKSKIPEMLNYYESKGCVLRSLNSVLEN